MFTDFTNCDKALFNLEKAGNIAGYFFGPDTGPLRIVIGRVQTLAGSALAACAIVAYLITADRDYLNTQAYHGAGYTMHGIFNVFRGAIEATGAPGSGLLLFGYDFCIARFHYYSEKVHPNEYTLNPFHPSVKEGKHLLA